MTTGAAGLDGAALRARHAAAGRRLAVVLGVGDPDAADLVTRAGDALEPAVVAGDLDPVAYRPHLLAAVRGLATQVEEEGAPAEAFAALPPATQATLWATVVERDRDPGPGPTVPEARAELTAALVDAHAATARRPVCRTTRADLDGYAAATLLPAAMQRVSAHLECCRGCTAVYLELADARTDLRGLVAGAVLGGAAAAYVAAIPPPTPEPGALDRIGAVVGSRAALVTGSLVLVAALVLAGLGLAAMLEGSGSPDAGDPYAAPAVTTPAVTAPSAPRPDRPTAVVQPAVATSAAGQGSAEDQGGAQVQPPGQQDGQNGDDQGNDGNGNGDQDSHDQDHDDQDSHDQDVEVTPPPVEVTVDPYAVDVKVSATTAAGLGIASVVTVDVTGLGTDRPGVVTIASDQLGATVQLDPRCSLVGLGSATCVLSGDSTLQVLATSLLAPTTMTVTAAPGAGLWDPSTADNTTSVALGGRV